MSQQSDQARASVTSLTPEPEVKEEKKEDDDFPQSLEEALFHGGISNNLKVAIAVDIFSS